ncbi:MAG: hypothetical protein IOD15_09170 [Phycisphaerales bacterium]|nr:hypothetical protein [Phycisphaerales bacterium]
MSLPFAMTLVHHRRAGIVVGERDVLVAVGVQAADGREEVPMMLMDEEVAMEVASAILKAVASVKAERTRRAREMGRINLMGMPSDPQAGTGSRRGGGSGGYT